MTRMILISMMSAAAMFAQSAPVTPQSSTAKTTTPVAKKKAVKKSVKATTAKPASSAKVASKPVVKQ